MGKVLSMEENYLNLRQQLPQEDWHRTPASVKKLVVEMGQGIEKLEQQVAKLRTTQQQLLERINRTSKNSSSPPSKDPANAPKQKEAADYEVTTREKTPLAKTVRTCRQLLKVEPAMWLFVTTVGVEPTNNDAERAIRPAVIWRRTSFSTQTKAGSFFVARMLSVVATLKSQRRNVLEFMLQAVVAARGGQSAPFLLPEVTITTSCDYDLPTAA